MFGGDPEAALIQYTKNEEARRAISSTEAVLNNRFIRVYWHRELGANATGLQQQEQSSGSQVAGSVPNQGLQHSNMHKVGINSGDIENPLMTILYIFFKISIDLPSLVLSAGDQAAQSSCLCVEQDCTQASSVCNSWGHDKCQVGQPESKHGHCCCMF